MYDYESSIYKSKEAELKILNGTFDIPDNTEVFVEGYFHDYKVSKKDGVLIVQDLETT